MKDKIFPCGNTLWDLNPFNVKLGNDYLDHLVTTGEVVGERVGYNIPSPKITRAFVPESRMKSLLKVERLKGYAKKYTIGLGIDYTWANFNYAMAKVVADTLLNTLEEKIHVVIDESSNTFSVYRKMKDTKIIHKIDEVYRVVRKL